MARQRLKTGYWSKEYAKLRKLQREAREKRASNPESSVPRNHEHYQRARVFIDKDMFIGKKAEQHSEPAYNAAHRYLDVREHITKDQVKELGARSASDAASKIVMDELITVETDIKECTEIIRGVSIGQVALKQAAFKS